MHFVLVPTGSAGDVHPFLGLGRNMVNRGHDVTIVTAEQFSAVVESIGAEFVSHQNTEDFNRVLDNPDLWDQSKGLRIVFSSLTSQLGSGLQAMESACRKDSFIVGHTISFHARVYEELTGTPAVTVHLAPSAFRSNHVLPAPIPGIDLASLPVWSKRVLWRLIDRFLLDPAILTQLNPWRARHGLAPVQRIFKSWIHSPNGTIGLFPEWFAQRQTDWAGSPHLTGFPLHDQGDGWTPDSGLRSFLQEGDPPVLFAHGSANRHARDFFATAIKAVGLMGGRAIIQTSFSESVSSHLPPNIHWVDYAPFSRLLPECAAIVHHGGIGTSAQGLAAGIPQLIVPLGFDQPDNATHLIRLGVANWISSKRLTPDRLARKLNGLLGEPGRQEHCHTWQERLQAASPIEETVDLIETLSSSD